MNVDDYIDEMVTHMQSFYCLSEFLGTALKIEVSNEFQRFSFINFMLLESILS